MQKQQNLLQSDPKCLDQNPQWKARYRELQRTSQFPLYPGAQLSVVRPSQVSDDFWQSLSFARRCGRLLGGLERIEGELRSKPVNPKGRVQRLVLCTTDGSERFYRALERLALQNQPAVMVMQIEEDSMRVGRELFGSPKAVKAIMVTSRETLDRVLKSLLLLA